MENTQIIGGLILVLIIGLATAYALRAKKNQIISEYAIDEIRRVLWEKGATATNFRILTKWEAFRHFGLSVIPNAAYREDYFVEVTASNENGAEDIHLTRIAVAFEKEILDSEWKFNHSKG